MYASVCLFINSVLVVFFLQHFRYFTPFSPCLHGFWEVGCNSYHCSFVGKVHIPPTPGAQHHPHPFFAFFKIFCIWFSAVWVWQDEMWFWGHLSCLVFSEFPGFVINFGMFGYYYFRYFFCSVPSSSGILIMHILCLLMLCHSSWMFCFFHSFSFHISVCEVFVDLFSSSLVLSLACCMVSPSEAFLVSITVVLTLSIYFWFFSRISIFLLIWLIYSWMLSNFSHSTL